MNAFNWNNGAPSVFARDPKFCAAAKSGKTQSQISSESADAYKDRTGRSLGTIVGISPASDLHAEESNHRRARKADKC